jgi:hypothetical protein
MFFKTWADFCKARDAILADQSFTDLERAAKWVALSKSATFPEFDKA